MNTESVIPGATEIQEKCVNVLQGNKLKDFCLILKIHSFPDKYKSYILLQFDQKLCPCRYLYSVFFIWLMINRVEFYH